jgi:hypothetical protein
MVRVYIKYQDVSRKLIQIEYFRNVSIYPNGLNEESKSFVSAFLKTEYDSSKLVEFVLVVEGLSKTDYEYEICREEVNELKLGWGSRNLVSHDVLFDPRSKAIIDGILRLRCEVKNMFSMLCSLLNQHVCCFRLQSWRN